MVTPKSQLSSKVITELFSFKGMKVNLLTREPRRDDSQTVYFRNGQKRKLATGRNICPRWGCWRPSRGNKRDIFPFYYLRVKSPRIRGSIEKVYHIFGNYIFNVMLKRYHSRSYACINRKKCRFAIKVFKNIYFHLLPQFHFLFLGGGICAEVFKLKRKDIIHIKLH